MCFKTQCCGASISTCIENSSTCQRCKQHYAVYFKRVHEACLGCSIPARGFSIVELNAPKTISAPDAFRAGDNNSPRLFQPRRVTPRNCHHGQQHSPAEFLTKIHSNLPRASFPTCMSPPDLRGFSILRKILSQAFTDHER